MFNLKCTLFFMLLFSGAVAQIPEKGISEDLAASRKKQISHIRYNLYFHVVPGNQRTVAEEEFVFDLNDPGKPVLIDYKTDSLAVSKMSVNGKEIQPVCINEHLSVSPELLQTKNNIIKISFISSGKPMKNGANGLVYCLFVPAKARECFPCFDQPDLKAVFQLSLTVPADWLAVSNGAIAASVVNANEQTIRFEETSEISTYLFSFAAGKFSKYTETRTDRTISFYYRETQQNKIDSNVKRCMDINFKALAFNEAYLGMKYPFNKFDFVEIPGFSVGGMEHPGSIFYRGDVIFLEQPSADQLYNRNRTIGHEVSHMWFGDLVTMKWFNEVWLKEVFANYIGDKFANTQSPDKSFNKKFLLGNFPAAYAIDRFPSADPIMRDLPNLNQAGLSYGAITYNKVPIMMHQLEMLIGEENFRKGVQDYIKKYAGGNADFSQLTAEFKKYTKKDLDQWLNAWVKKPGRPIFDYRIESKYGKIEKFYLRQQGEYDPKLFWPQQFDLILFYDSSRMETIRVDMQSAIQTISAAENKLLPKYILFNTSGEGYGVFPIDKNFVEKGLMSVSVEARASAVVNLFERMLRSKENEPAGNFLSGPKPSPKEMLTILSELIRKENDLQLLERELRYAELICFRLLKPETRKHLGPVLEKDLLAALQLQTAVNKTSVFRTYMRIAETPIAVDSLYHYWDKRTLPEGVKFGTADWSQLAKQLALRNYRTDEVLSRQLDSLKRYNDRKSFSYQMKALSSEVAVRDSFFNSLLSYAGRNVESDVLVSLQLLHHPLRQNESRKYIESSLKILSEILYSNDLFFAPDWISSIVENYSDHETAEMLRSFLAKPHPEIPCLLMQKLRQSADWVFRAEAVSE